MAYALTPDNLTVVAEKLKKAMRAVRAATYAVNGKTEPAGVAVTAVRDAIAAQSTANGAAKAVVDLF
jgi:uncharacterized protein (DUF169 family)